MIHRPALTVVLATLTLLVTTVVGAPPGTAARKAHTVPSGLTVQITSMTPSAIPKHGPIELDGVISNESHQTWTAVNAYPLTSYAPMTTRAEVDAAALTDPATDFGERLLSSGVRVGDLPPGARAPFHIRVRRSQLDISGQPGVYWIGVHALGANREGRDQVADGRARTFVPLVTGHGHAAQVALVVPVRADVHRAPDGSLQHVSAFAAGLAPDGRLGRLAAFGQLAGSRPLTWLVDPSVLDAAQAVADGDPALGVGAAKKGSASPSPTPTASNGDAAVPALTDADRTNATNWLKAITTLAKAGSTLGLPYGDPDVSRVVRADGPLLAKARTLSHAVFTARNIPATPAYAPLDGYLAPSLADSVPSGTTVLVGDHGQRAAPTGPSTLVDNRDWVLTDSRTAAGGPLPQPRTDALELRQRILADAAIVALRHRTGGTLVVPLPSDWNPPGPTRGSAFFTGLDQTWLSLVGVPSGTPGTTPKLPWPRAARRAQVPGLNVSAARQLARTDATLTQLVDDPDTDTRVDKVLTGAALGTVSYAARRDPVRARIRADNLDQAIQALLAGVTVVGTQFVTLSGGSGTLTVGLVNGLDQPITVGLHARTGNERIRLDSPSPVKLAAGQRSTVRLHANASVIGVHEVTLTPVTSAGRRVGTPLLFNLRTSNVGRVFWAVLGAGAVLLVLLVLRRVRQRLRSPRWRE